MGELCEQSILRGWGRAAVSLLIMALYNQVSAALRRTDYTLWLTLITYNYIKLKMEIEAAGAYNWDTNDTTTV